jgi:hypothetical protein
MLVIWLEPLGVYQQMKDFEQHALRRHDFHGEWNYTLTPQRPRAPT